MYVCGVYACKFACVGMLVWEQMQAGVCVCVCFQVSELRFTPGAGCFSLTFSLQEVTQTSNFPFRDEHSAVFSVLCSQMRCGSVG